MRAELGDGAGEVDGSSPATMTSATSDARSRRRVGVEHRDDVRPLRRRGEERRIPVEAAAAETTAIGGTGCAACRRCPGRRCRQTHRAVVLGPHRAGRHEHEVGQRPQIANSALSAGPPSAPDTPFHDVPCVLQKTGGHKAKAAQILGLLPPPHRKVAELKVTQNPNEVPSPCASGERVRERAHFAQRRLPHAQPSRPDLRGAAGALTTSTQGGHRRTIAMSGAPRALRL